MVDNPVKAIGILKPLSKEVKFQNNSQQFIIMKMTYLILPRIRIVVLKMERTRFWSSTKAGGCSVCMQ